MLKKEYRSLNLLENREFDVLIIGGGISGAWLALHCSHQGYKTALIEQGDYASQTSSASSKILHSGIRYLQQMQFGRVRESALERAHYLYAAPHLSVSVPFAVPTYKDIPRSKLFLNCGMLAYRFLCLGENQIIAAKDQRLAAIKSISAEALQQICPLKDKDNTGAVVFHERHMHDSERMVLSILQTAQKAGAQIFNHIRAESLIYENNQVIGANAIDQIDHKQFKIHSQLTINAAGPWIDELNSTFNSAKFNKKHITGFAVGSHIITRQLSDHAIAVTTQHQSDAKIDRGGRHVFIIPWRGFSLIGTSYDEITTPVLNSSIQKDHVKQLLDAVNQALPDVNLESKDLVSGYSGLYPLKTENIQSKVYQGSGEYKIIDHAEVDQVDGYITALGAKYTTGRKLSTLTMRLIAAKLNRHTNTKNDKVKLHNNQYTSLTAFTAKKLQQYQAVLTDEQIRHLVGNYGSDIDAFVEMLNMSPDNELMQPLCQGQPDLLGQVKWAIEHEQAYLLKDVLFGRTSVGLLGIKDHEIEFIARYMAKELDWNSNFLQQQLTLALNDQKQMRDCLNVA